MAAYTKPQRKKKDKNERLKDWEIRSNLLCTKEQQHNHIREQSEGLFRFKEPEYRIMNVGQKDLKCVERMPA